MTNLTTELMKSLLINENNLPAFEQTISELFRSELEKSLNEILAYELTAFLDYERYERSDNLNSRNGSYQRKPDTRYGQITLNIPGDRLGEFYTILIPRYRRRDFSTDQTILDLYEEGMANTEIAGIIWKLCGASYSKQTISNITDKALESIEAFKNRTLNKEYAVVYLDGTSMALRRDTVAKEMVHIALGITLEGTKEILGYLIAPAESAETWSELLYNLKDRGLERMDFPGWRLSLKIHFHSQTSSAALCMYRGIFHIRHGCQPENRLPLILSRYILQRISKPPRKNWTPSSKNGERNIHPLTNHLQTMNIYSPSMIIRNPCNQASIRPIL